MFTSYVAPGLVVVLCYSVSCVHLFVTPWAVAHQAPLSMGFSRKEYWSGLPCPPLGSLPIQGWNPGLPHCRQILNGLRPQGSHNPRHSEGPVWISSSEAKRKRQIASIGLRQIGVTGIIPTGLEATCLVNNKQWDTTFWKSSIHPLQVILLQD